MENESNLLVEVDTADHLGGRMLGGNGGDRLDRIRVSKNMPGVTGDIPSLFFDFRDSRMVLKKQV